jgi:hypothetical protein
MTNETVKVTVPFQGFYESIHDMNIDDAVADACSYDACEDKDNFDGYDELTEEEQNTAEDNVNRFNYKPVFLEYARKHCELFAEEYDLPSLKFDELIQPREYNFSTDVIVATIKLEELEALCATFDIKEFANYIEDILAPRSGFAPFYSNDLSDWDDFEDWDDVQYGIVLDFVALDDEDFEVHAEYMVNEFQSIN